MFARGIRARGGGMNEIEQDKSPLAGHCHRPKRGLREVVYVSHSANGNMGYGWVKAGMIFPFLDRQVPKPPARRGRPPNKNKKPAVTPTSQDTAPDVIYAPKPTTVPEKPAIIDNFRWINEQRTEGNAELSGRFCVERPFGKMWTSYDEFPILSTFDQERKLLVPLWHNLNWGRPLKESLNWSTDFKEEGKGDNGLLFGPKAAQEELKKERVKTGKRDPSPD